MLTAFSFTIKHEFPEETFSFLTEKGNFSKPSFLQESEDFGIDFQIQRLKQAFRTVLFYIKTSSLLIQNEFQLEIQVN